MLSSISILVVSGEPAKKMVSREHPELRGAACLLWNVQKRCRPARPTVIVNHVLRWPAAGPDLTDRDEARRTLRHTDAVVCYFKAR